MTLLAPVANIIIFFGACTLIISPHWARWTHNSTRWSYFPNHCQNHWLIRFRLNPQLDQMKLHPMDVWFCILSSSVLENFDSSNFQKTSFFFNTTRFYLLRLQGRSKVLYWFFANFVWNWRYFERRNKLLNIHQLLRQIFDLDLEFWHCLSMTF